MVRGQGSGVSEDGRDVLIKVKAVPGASRDEISGMVGDRLKVRVSAPPEGGKANKAICALVAKALAVKPRLVTVESGHSSPEKTLRVTSYRLDAARSALTPDP